MDASLLLKLVCQCKYVTFYTVHNIPPSRISVYMLHIPCRGPCSALRDQKNNNCYLIAALSPGGRVCRVSPWGRCVCIGSLSSPTGPKRRFILQSYWLDKQSLVLHQAPAAVYEPFIDDSGKLVQPVSRYPLQGKSQIRESGCFKHSEEFTWLFFNHCD